MDKKNTESVEQQLRHSQRLNQQAESLGGPGFWEWDVAEDRMTYCSEGFARIIEMTRDEVMARYDSWKLYQRVIHPDDLSAAIQDRHINIPDLCL